MHANAMQTERISAAVKLSLKGGERRLLVLKQQSITRMADDACGFHWYSF